MTANDDKGAAGPENGLSTTETGYPIISWDEDDWRRAAIAEQEAQRGNQRLYEMYLDPIVLSDDMSIGQIMRQCRRMRDTDYMMCTAAQLADEFGISDEMASQIYAYLHDEDDDEEASE